MVTPCPKTFKFGSLIEDTVSSNRTLCSFNLLLLRWSDPLPLEDLAQELRFYNSSKPVAISYYWGQNNTVWDKNPSGEISGGYRLGASSWCWVILCRCETKLYGVAIDGLQNARYWYFLYHNRLLYWSENEMDSFTFLSYAATVLSGSVPRNGGRVICYQACLLENSCVSQSKIRSIKYHVYFLSQGAFRLCPLQPIDKVKKGQALTQLLNFQCQYAHFTEFCVCMWFIFILVYMYLRHIWVYNCQRVSKVYLNIFTLVT